MQEETFSDHIEEAAFKKSGEAIPQLAADLAHQLTASRMARLNAKYQAMIISDLAALPAPTQATPKTKSAAPSNMDKIKARLEEAIAPRAGSGNGHNLATLADDGEGRSAPK